MKNFVFLKQFVFCNLSNATFRLADLMNADKPVSLYICVPPSQLTRLVPLIRIMLTQIVTILADKLHFEGGQAKGDFVHRMLLMLDEFPTLGNMEIFETALAFVAGYGMKSYIIVQDLKQLYKRYSEKESIVSNTHVQVAYAPNNLETAKTLSEIIGTTTVIKEVKSTSMTKGTMTYSTSTQEQQRALLTPQEVMTLKGPKKNSRGLIEEPGDMIVKVSGFPVILGRQILYFKDPVFQRRAEITAPAMSDVLYVNEKPAYDVPQKPWEKQSQGEDTETARIIMDRLQNPYKAKGEIGEETSAPDTPLRPSQTPPDGQSATTAADDHDEAEERDLQKFFGEKYDEWEDDGEEEVI